MLVTTLDRDPRHLQHVERAIRAEFNEMPGMQLTFAQCRRLFGLSSEECAEALQHLVASRFLAEDAEHQFFRR
jgi:hypothetical protein